MIVFRGFLVGKGLAYYFGWLHLSKYQKFIFIKMKASMHTLQLETISFLLIPFWMAIAELQGQAMKESWKASLGLTHAFH